MQLFKNLFSDQEQKMGCGTIERMCRLALNIALTYCIVVPAQVGGGATYKGYRAVIYISYLSAHFYQLELVRHYIVYPN